MINRGVEKQLLFKLQHVPAVALLGPRQVGKTTLAKKLANRLPSTYLDLENPADLQKLSDPELYFDQHDDALIIIDEIQRRPDLFQVLRGQIDKHRQQGKNSGQFLLLGSASNDLLQQSSESLAGRISYTELFPFTVPEVSEKSHGDLWVNGGFPEAFLNKDFSLTWRKDFIRTYLERDIPQLGSRIPAASLRRFWTMLAHNQGQMFNASAIGGSLGVSGPTASRYLDLLVDLLLVRRLPPWYTNVGKRLVKSPKTFVRDSGILHALLNIPTLEDLQGHPIVGPSWEGFVLENILSVVPDHVDPYFYRTAAGAEVDVVLDSGDDLTVIEIKRSTAPKVTKGFYNACEDIQPTKKWVVYAGEEEYEMANGVVATSVKSIVDHVGE